MSANKVDLVKLAHLLRTGVSSTECAKQFGVSVGAITQHKKKLLAAAGTLPDVVNSGLDTDSIDAMQQLTNLNKTIVTILARLERLVAREEIRTEALDTLQVELAKTPNNVDAQDIFDKIWGNNLKSILAIQMNAINGSAEIRKQIELALKMAETIYNVQNVQEFQADILSVIQDVSPEARDKIIDKLRKRRAVRGLIRP
jgi:ABC-type dipeptide/oligopeptide/nickel transport system ATPase component